MFQLVNRDDVLRVIKSYGPLQPLGIKRFLKKGDSTIIGAVLSELVSSKLVAITHLKRGTSPFYYDPNNPASLEKIASFLNEKDYRAFKLLKESKVLLAKDLDPLTRVSLSNIKDFSKPGSLLVNGQEIIFFKYYLLSDEEAYDLVKERLMPKKSEPAVKKTEETHNEEVLQTLEKKEVIVNDVVNNVNNVVDEKPINKPVVVNNDSRLSDAVLKADSEKEVVEAVREGLEPERVNNVKVVEKAVTKGFEDEEPSVNNTAVNDESVIENKVNNAVETLKSDKINQPVDKKSVSDLKKDSSTTVKDQGFVSASETLLSIDDPFFLQVKDYFLKKKVIIREATLVRKNRELDLLVDVPTPLGYVLFYCKAKNKKKSNDGDVASALLKGQEFRKPVIYLTSGSVTKKALNNKDLKVISWELQ